MNASKANGNGDDHQDGDGKDGLHAQINALRAQRTRLQTEVGALQDERRDLHRRLATCEQDNRRLSAENRRLRGES